MADESTTAARVCPVAIRSTLAYLVLLGVAAVLMGLAYPQPGWWWCAHIGLAPAAVLAVGSTSFARLIVLSFATAWAWWLVRIAWLAGVTGGGYVGLAAAMALYGPVVLAAVRLLYRRYPFLPLTIIFPMAWVSLELVRGSWPAGGFAWFMLGHSQAPFTDEQGAGRLIQIADVFGELGVSFLVAMTNGLAADLFIAYASVRHRTKQGHGHTARWGVGLWVLATGGALIYGGVRLSQTDDAAGPAFNMAVVQTNVSQDNKDRPTSSQQLENWTDLLNLTSQAASDRLSPSLIVWPETMAPAPLNPEAMDYFQEKARQNPEAAQALLYHRQILSTARSLNVDLIVGAAAYTWKDNPGRYNAAYLYLNNGTQSGQRYDKIHRVPFGEYIPWVERWPWLKEKFIKYFSPYETDYTLQPGREWTVFRVRSGVSLLGQTPHKPRDASVPDAAKVVTAPSEVRIATPICFEDVVAPVCRAMVYGDGGEKRVDVLVNLTNDGWYSGRHQRVQHLQIAGAALCGEPYTHGAQRQHRRQRVHRFSRAGGAHGAGRRQAPICRGVGGPRRQARSSRVLVGQVGTNPSGAFGGGDGGDVYPGGVPS